MKEGWKVVPLECAIDNLRTGLNPRVHFKLNTPDATGYYVTVRELKGWTFEVDDKTDRINQAAVKRINERSNLLVGDVLYSGTGTIGNTAIVQEEPSWWNIKEGVYAITPKSDLLESRFLIYVLKKLKDLIVSKSSGTTIKSIPMKELRKIEIPLPPLPEQQRIVEYLDSTFAEIDALKAKAAEEVANAKAMFDAALREEMTPKEDIPMKQIGEIFKSYSGGTPIKSNKEYYENGNIPWLRSGEVCQKYINKTEMFITEAGLKNSSAKYYPVNTVVIAMYGATAAQVGILKIEATSNQAVCGLLPNDSYSPEFVYYWFSAIQKDLAAQAQGGAQPNISQEKIKKVHIPIMDIEKQQSIVARLDTLRTLVTSLEQKYAKIAAECDALKQAILKETFE